MASGKILADLVKELDTNVYQFEKEIKASRGRIAAAIDRDSEIGTDIAALILKRYSDVRPEWLITGEGSIFKQQANTGISTTSAHEHDAHYGPITPLRTMTEEEKLALYQTGDWDATRKMVAERLVNGSLTDLLTELFMQRGMGA